MDLTNEQKKQIVDLFQNETTNLNEITQTIFKNAALDGRTIEGRAVKKFLASKGHKTKVTTKKAGANKPLELNEEQKKFAIDQSNKGLNTLRIAELLFPKNKVVKLGAEMKAVIAAVKEANPDFAISQGSTNTSDYSPPRALSRIVKIINDAVGVNLMEGKLNREYQVRCEKLITNLSNSRFVRIMNDFEDPSDRQLFMEEFVRLTWDKPDLTADEVNLYFNVAKDTLNLEKISRHINKLNMLFEDVGDQSEMSIKLSDMIKNKGDEYHKCQQRIESLTTKLQGTRGDRMKAKGRNTVSILSLVRAFQEGEERVNAVELANMKKEAISQTANSLETMDAFKARILGLTKDDIL